MGDEQNSVDFSTFSFDRQRGTILEPHKSQEISGAWTDKADRLSKFGMHKVKNGAVRLHCDILPSFWQLCPTLSVDL